VLPSRKTSRVKSLLGPDGSIDTAFPPMAVTITTEDEIDISRGDMIVHSDDIPEVSDCFDAMIVWMHEKPMLKNKLYDLKRASTLVSARIDEIYYKIDVNTLEHKPAQELRLNEIAYVRLNLSSQIAYDTYKDHKQTGSFILIDRISNNTLAAGMIYKKQESRNVVWHDHRIANKDRTQLKGHSPAVIWLTGLSGAGKSTIANELEHTLNKMGIHTYLLDGDNVRHGLCKDLGFSDKDRVENIRRIGEVAKLFSDAGIVVITAFISPFKNDREMVRAILPQGEFVEVFVDAPLTVCEERDPKSLYKKARKGEIKSFTGIDSPYEAPELPEIHLQTDKHTVAESVEKILEFLNNSSIISL
jgi:bifunctional enzyme CysN/CysC